MKVEIEDLKRLKGSPVWKKVQDKLDDYRESTLMVMATAKKEEDGVLLWRGMGAIDMLRRVMFMLDEMIEEQELELKLSGGEKE